MDDGLKPIGLKDVEARVGNEAGDGQDCVALWVETCHLDWARDAWICELGF